MNLLGNIIWLILGGLPVALIYYFAALLMCITIIGIPFGVQLFKLGTYALWPFGHELVNGPNQPGCASVVMNLIWILLGWWEMALIHLACGLIFCLTIVGIPWAFSTSRWRQVQYSRSERRYTDQLYRTLPNLPQLRKAGTNLAQVATATVPNQ